MHVNTRYINSTRGTFSKRYIWWSLCTLYLHACHVRVTVGNSGLCFVLVYLSYVFQALINSLDSVRALWVSFCLRFVTEHSGQRGDQWAQWPVAGTVVHLYCGWLAQWSVSTYSNQSVRTMINQYNDQSALWSVSTVVSWHCDRSMQWSVSTMISWYCDRSM